MDRFLLCKSKTPRDDEYVDAYLKTHSQTKAAELCGVSRETIARAVRRAGIALTGRKHNKVCGGYSDPKITDDELRSEVEWNPDAQVIAEKYGMSIEQVSRRCLKLGLKVNCTSHRWHQRAKYYGCTEIDKSITLDRLRKRDGDICYICGCLVDDTDIDGTHVGAKYPSCDHVIPLSKGGTHTWDNVRLAHMGCNAGKCNKIITV